MPRIQPIDPNQAQGKAKVLLDGVRKVYGFAPNLIRTLAHSPAALEAYLSFGKALGGGSLSPQLREQIALAVSNANSCEYCTSAHSALGAKLGLSEEELKANLEGSSSDARTEAALRFARQIILQQGWVKDEELEAVRHSGYSDGEVAEIVATVAATTFSNYFNHVAHTEVDFPLVGIGSPAKAPADRSASATSCDF